MIHQLSAQATSTKAIDTQNDRQDNSHSTKNGAMPDPSGSKNPLVQGASLRVYPARATLFSALATGFVSLGMAPTALADSLMAGQAIGKSPTSLEAAILEADTPSAVTEAYDDQAPQQRPQMLTPEQIEHELAVLSSQHRPEIDSDFTAPIATLEDTSPPIGLDMTLDTDFLPEPNNLETLGQNEALGQPVNTSQAASHPEDISDALEAENIKTAHPSHPATMASQTTDVTQMTDKEGLPSNIINPTDYLPAYQADTPVADDNSHQPRPQSQDGGPTVIKRLYNRLFNDDAVATPTVETTIYMQRPTLADKGTRNPIETVADSNRQPMKNIKAALDDTAVQSVADFTAALPRLRQTALDAARAVGYYDIALTVRQPSSHTLEVVIESLGEPVRVDSRVVEVRGDGRKQAEFVALAKELPPKEGDVFNHRVYKNAKAALESLSNTYGYFDQYWLNKSVDIILPDNTAEISLVYDTGSRYQFDEVVFFTYDRQTNTLTQDPDKLPVERSLLQQLLGFEPGDPFYAPDVTTFSNDLSATRYFNTVNVESILPPDQRSAASTLAFDSTPASDGDEGLDTDTNATKAPADAADVAALEFEADDETLDKLRAIEQKADRLSRLPNDRVLDEKEQVSDTILGKISDSISTIAQKILPDEADLLADENFVPPTLVGRKTPKEVAMSKKVPLYVFVSSSKPRDAQLGLGYGTDTGARATAKIDYNLINRQGYQAGAETEVSSISKNVTVYASRPWKHPLNDKLEGRLTYEEEVIDQGVGNFDLSTRTLKAALARNIRRDNGWNQSYSMRYRLDKLETGIEGAALKDLPIRFTSSNPTQQALLFGYGVNKTTVDRSDNPTRGLRRSYSIEAGSDKAASDTNMAIARASVSGLYSFGADDKHQVLASLDTGYIWADDFYDVPYKLRFFAGGDQSIRGYDYESLSPLDNGYLAGGQILAVGSAEYNYEFKPGIRGAFFTDVGNAYDKNFETSTKVGVGVGVRWASPVGVVRVDVAAGVTEDSIPIRLHLFIGSPL